MSNDGHSAMSSAKSSSGVHFYGRMYVGYDDRSVGKAADDESLEDSGNKSRLGLKFKENLGGGLQLIGNLEYKFDSIDGTSNDDADCSGANTTDDCRTFNLHIGNLGFKTGFGYIGAGTYESPYKTMGQFDHNIDTAWALNQHGATSRSNAGIDGNFEGAISYHNQMGPLEIAYMYAVNDAQNNDETNTDQGDYSTGLQLKDMFMSGLVIGYSRNHSHDDGESNDRFYASMKVLPNAGVFVSLEDLQISGSYLSGVASGDVTTIGTHYSMGSTDLQIVYAKGDSDGAATEDYKTLGLSAKMNLSKTSDLTFGYAKQDFDSTGSDVTTRGIGLTHRF
jgi:predicted porin